MGGAFETSRVQKVFDFGLAELRTSAQKVAEVRPRTATPAGTAAAKRTAYDWFAEGTLREAGINVEPGTDGDAQAEVCYQQALALDAGLAAAHTNLGSIAHRRAATPPPRRAPRSSARSPSIPTRSRRASTSRTSSSKSGRPRARRPPRVPPRPSGRARLRRRPLQPRGRARAPRGRAQARAHPREVPVASASTPSARRGADVDGLGLGRAGAHADRAPRADRTGSRPGREEEWPGV